MLFALKRPYVIALYLITLLQGAALASHAIRVNKVVIEEAQRQAEAAAQQYAELVKKGFNQAQSLGAAKIPSRCPINQSCFGKKSASLEQESKPDLTLADSPQPLVFISSSMPLIALQELALEAKKHKARLVIRGMVNNSMKETGNLAKEINHPVAIDPKLFKKYNVRQVPTFALPYGNKEGEDKKGIEWIIVRGNINLTYALEKAVGKGKFNMKGTIEESRVVFHKEPHP